MPTKGTIFLRLPETVLDISRAAVKSNNKMTVGKTGGFNYIKRIENTKNQFFM